MPSALRNRTTTTTTATATVSFHDFKSQNFKLSVSNPKSKYVAYLSVLSQISNCQGLGRKNKHGILKTDRTTTTATAKTTAKTTTATNTITNDNNNENNDSMIVIITNH